MSNPEIKRFLKILQSRKTITRKELHQKGYSKQDISFLLGWKYIRQTSAPKNVRGQLIDQDTDMFTIDDAGYNFLEDYHYLDKPLLYSRTAISISILAIIISVTSSDFLRGLIYSFWLMLLSVFH